MNLFACYRWLLGFYPKEFRREFSEEMLQVFERRWQERAALGRAASVGFVVSELVGLLKGAQIMWMEKILPMRRKQVTDAGLQESACSTAELGKRREAAVSRMVQAIAQHDFPGARRYSEEEMRLAALLRERSERALAS
jgi:hypothetical protein